ncbi:galactose mutarotase-like protein [Basidiobolus meristosporus CBS 931.73]|uniref:Glucose-6-phosphate 1-epimerase n=1 Tax=Basidiobolus meristosporus CBS 931.73 TaxID=1314790 RepID=A0A1Y1XWI2_9FUNG|nr:galactose mutarotase-like protein [Basidiobolus meristosporus CBS 931.73]|eukprot:ORX90119.1 galactose mutarotase-like protein [Basidiobolus meristosporus CBS 931.73]
MTWSRKAVRIIQAEDGSPDQIVLNHPEGAAATISLYGATVTSWKVKDAERLFVSQKAILNGTKAIRGGIPLVFPNFGKAEAPNPAAGLPQHGFARITRCLNGVQIGPDFRKIWPLTFELVYTVILKADTLETNLTDVSNASVSGLHGYQYTDKVKCIEGKEDRSAIQVNSEVDSVYKNVTSLELKLNHGHGKALFIRKNNLDDAVIWNPWVERANGMADFGDDEYKSMICVECGIVVNPIRLDPDDVWEGGQIVQATLKLEPVASCL